MSSHYQGPPAPDSPEAPVLWGEPGSTVLILAWVAQWLAQTMRTRQAETSESVRRQAEQTESLIRILAADRQRMAEALNELQQSIEQLKELAKDD